MGEGLINWTTFIRNVISSSIFGLLVPYLIFRYIDPNGLIFDYSMMIFNGALFVLCSSMYGLFRKETFIRFIFGCIYVGFVIYFYTSGYTIFSMYLPHCGFGVLCLSGRFAGYIFALSYTYFYTCVIVVSLKFINTFRHLIKPPDEEHKYKVAALKKMRLRD